MKLLYISILFIICVTVRSLLAYWAYKNEQDRQTYISTIDEKNQWIIIGIITFLIGLGFIWRYFNYVPIGVFGSKVYWCRPFHGFMYMLFSVLWFLNIPNSYIILLIDVIIGVVTFLLNYIN